MTARIAFVGAAGSGKDYAARILVEKYGYRRVAFADRLKTEAYAALHSLNPTYVSPSVAIDWFNVRKREDAIRAYLQTYGVAKRQFVNDYYWVDYALTTVKAFEDSFGPQSWVLTDLRFPNEAEALRETGFSLVRIVGAGGLSAQLAAHVSESGQDAIQVDYVLENTLDGAFDFGVERVHDLVMARKT
jgi:hypothetical protein